VLGLVTIGRDITERRKLEEQLRQSQKLDAVGQLAGGVAHDFNNLLTVILSNLELARERPTPELLGAAETATRRAAELTGQLLGFARRQPLRSEPVNVNDHLRETATLIRRTIDPRIILAVSLSSEPAIILGDPGQINQVLLNLCLNARDAMPAGGTLSLSTSVADNEVILRIRDTGVGMTSEVQSRIFEPFFTTKGLGEGTGLGLAVVFGIIEAHGGRILCESRVGEGTLFEIRLPAHRAELPVVAPATTTARTLALGAKILLADDEPMIRELARLILEPLGYQVTAVPDGLEAVKTFRAAGGQFDLVILDLTMPNLAGRDALREIRTINAEVPVLLASGYSQDRAAASPASNGFLEKPFTPADLIAAVQKALGQS
jgi:two-component system cell cycle sensor histidine kinase/response regulator CckA